MNNPLTKLDLIVETAAQLVHEYIYEDWEDSGQSCFDPFGEYKEALLKKLEAMELPQ